jgi:hypothetical protein
MRIRLVKLKDLTGIKATFYTIYYNNDNDSLFKQFINGYINSYKSEVLEIYNRIIVMGNEEGARRYNFTEEEGTPGDMVCALCDKPGKNLRLYCIRYSENLVILGSGGFKPKSISALQDDPILKKENKKVVQIAKLIETRKSEGEIYISSDGRRFIGELTLKDDYYEE